jgi:hypothetical protein
MQKQTEAMVTMVSGQESLEKTMESFVDGMTQQAEGITQQVRESKANMIDNFVVFDSKMGTLAHVQEQQTRLCTVHILENRQLRQDLDSSRNSKTA